MSDSEVTDATLAMEDGGYVLVGWGLDATDEACIRSVRLALRDAGLAHPHRQPGWALLSPEGDPRAAVLGVVVSHMPVEVFVEGALDFDVREALTQHAVPRAAITQAKRAVRTERPRVEALLDALGWGAALPAKATASIVLIAQGTETFAEVDAGSTRKLSSSERFATDLGLLRGDLVLRAWAAPLD